MISLVLSWESATRDDYHACMYSFAWLPFTVSRYITQENTFSFSLTSFVRRENINFELPKKGQTVLRNNPRIYPYLEKTVCYRDRQTDRQAGRPAGRQAGRQAGRRICLGGYHWGKDMHRHLDLATVCR